MPEVLGRQKKGQSVAVELLFAPIAPASATWGPCSQVAAVSVVGAAVAAAVAEAAVVVVLLAVVASQRQVVLQWPAWRVARYFETRSTLA